MPVHRDREKKESTAEEMEVEEHEQEASSSEDEDSDTSSVSEDGDSSGLITWPKSIGVKCLTKISSICLSHWLWCKCLYNCIQSMGLYENKTTIKKCFKVTKAYHNENAKEEEQ